VIDDHRSELRRATAPWLACALLAGAGFLLNLAPLETFPGIHFLFGGVFALVAAVRYGPVAGGVVGLVAALPSWSLWNQPVPLSALLYGLEGVWVGLVTRRTRWGPLAAAVAYWLLLGSWLNLALQLAVIGLPARIGFIIQCRSVINGLLVAMIVELGFLVHGLAAHKTAAGRVAPRRPPTLQTLVTLVVTALISLPILWLIVRDARGSVDRRVAELRASSQREVEAIRGELGALVASHSMGAPVLDETGELTAGGGGGGLDVGASVHRIVDRFDADDHGTVAVITDRSGRLIADSRLGPGSSTAARDLSRDPDYRRMAGRAEGAVLVSGEGEEDESPALAVARAHHLLTFTTEPVTGWRIWIHQSLAPVQATLLRSTATHLLVLVLALLAALALSAGLARLVTAPLERLRRSAERLAAGDLSERPEETALPTVEIDSLFRSFSGMADRLDQSWQLQHRLLEQVSVTNRELQATFDAMTDALVITDAHDRVLHANYAFHEMAGLEPGWAVGRLLHEVGHPDGGWEGCRSCVVRRSGESATVRLRADENTTGRPVEIRIDHIRDRDGRPIRSVQVIRDRTEEERTAERDRRDDKLRALGQLAAGVAHNFNNALTSVLGYTQLAASLTDDGRLRRHLDTVEVAALDAAKMVRRIQQFARSDKEEPLEEASLGALVQDAVALTRSRWESDAQAAGILYRLHLRPGPDQVVRCDSSALREVFVNLIINALDAMPDGGDLTIETGAAEGRAWAAVSDTGCGMGEEVRERIFEPFFTTKGPRGQGMGLAVSYGTIRRHRGQVHVESEPGAGSRLTVTLPALRPAAGSAVLAGARRVRADGGWRGRVLVAEDEAAIRGLVTTVLEGAALRVETAADGAEALRMLAASPAYDLVITDLAMPGADGLAVARAAHAAAPRPRVLVMTGYGEGQREASGNGDGSSVDVWLSKPFDCSELLDRVEELLGAELYRKRRSSTLARPSSSASMRT